MALYLFLFALLLPSFSLETIEDKDVLQPPNPLSLTTDFFTYFETDDKEALNTRIKKTIEAIGALHESILENSQRETLMVVNKIALNLEALARLKEEKEGKVRPRLYRTSYTFEDIETLLNNDAKTTDREINLLKEKSSLTSLRKKIERHIDSQMAAYLKMGENTQEKLILGLQIFAHTASLAVMKEKERVLNEKIEADLKKTEEFKREKIFAFEHLENPPGLLTGLKKEIESQNELLKMRELGSLHAELSATTLFGDSDKEQSEGYLSIQKAIHAEAEVALLNLKILELLAKKQIVLEVTGDNSPIDMDEIIAWKRQMEEIASEKELWNAKTEVELERVGRLGFALDDQSIKASSNPLATLAIARYHEVQESLNLIAALDKKLMFVNALTDYADKHLKKNLTPIEAIAGNTKRAFDDCCSTVDGWLHLSLFKIASVPITLMSLLEALMILGGAYFISWFLRAMIRRLIKDKSSFSHSNLFIVDRLLHYLILTVGLAFALLSAGLEISSIFWVLGALSVGIGFGLQTIVNNFASSLILLFSRSIKVQDYIQLESGEYGQVIDISVQSTIVRTSEGIEIVIPNSQLISAKFMNWTMNDPYKRLHVPFNVAYGTDKELVEKAAIEAALKVPATINNHPHLEGPSASLKAFGASSLDFELDVWVNLFSGKGEHGSLQSSYLWELETALNKHGITIPFPQCDVTLKHSVDKIPEMVSQKNVIHSQNT